MFLEMADAERGSLLLGTADQQLDVDAARAFGNEDDAALAVAERFAPEVARDRCPRIILDVPRKRSRDRLRRPRASSCRSSISDPGRRRRPVDRRGSEAFSEGDSRRRPCSRAAREQSRERDQITELHQMAVIDR